LPGTGTYLQQSSGGGSHGKSPQQAVETVDPAQLIPKPGRLASVAERAYHRGLVSYLGGEVTAALESFEWVIATDPSAASASLFAGVAANSIGDAPRAIKHLESVVGSANALPDRYQAKFLPTSLSLTLAVRITDSISAAPAFGELAAALALAELYQNAGRLDEAIGLLQQLDDSLPDPLVRLSLCDLLYTDADYEAVIETSAGVTNESDVEVETMHLRGAAFLATGQPTAAVETFTAALGKTSNREARLLNAVRYDRAIVLDQLGEPTRAREDFERVYAADPAFEDVKDRLEATP
jgi:tetratricopeptide (TPR) repeat protein